jgi:hypothetical protein
MYYSPLNPGPTSSLISSPLNSYNRNNYGFCYSSSNYPNPYMMNYIPQLLNSLTTIITKALDTLISAKSSNDEQQDCSNKKEKTQQETNLCRNCKEEKNLSVEFEELTQAES